MKYLVLPVVTISPTEFSILVTRVSRPFHLRIQVIDAFSICGNVAVGDFQLTNVYGIGVCRTRRDVSDLTLPSSLPTENSPTEFCGASSVVGGVVSLCAASGLRTITHCKPV